MNRLIERLTIEEQRAIDKVLQTYLDSLQPISIADVLTINALDTAIKKIFPKNKVILKFRVKYDIEDFQQLSVLTHQGKCIK